MTEQGKNPQAVDFETTLAALNSQGTSLNPAAAIGTIEGWRQRLAQSGEPEVAPIVNDLDELKHLLTTNPLNGAAIGAVLQRLGSQTVAANERGRHGVSSVVYHLGQRLQQLGDMLVADSER